MYTIITGPKRNSTLHPKHGKSTFYLPTRRVLREGKGILFPSASSRVNASCSLLVTVPPQGQRKRWEGQGRQHSISANTAGAPRYCPMKVVLVVASYRQLQVKSRSDQNGSTSSHSQYQHRSSHITKVSTAKGVPDQVYNVEICC